MARPGKSKARRVESKGGTVAVAAPASPELQVSIVQLLAAPPEADLLAQFTERSGTVPGGAMALVDALGGSRDEAAGRVLNVVATAAPDKDLRKSARRALHKLRSAGLTVTLPVADHEPVTALVREPLQVIQALVSSTDGVGSRLLWLVMERPNSYGALTVFNLALNDIVGLKDMFANDMSRRRFEARLEEWRAAASHRTVDVPVEYGLALLSEALALNAESAFPIPREFVVRRQLLGELPPPPSEALIHQYISRGQMLLMPNLLEESDELFEVESEVHRWLFGYSEMQPFVSEYLGESHGLLIVTADSDEEQEERAISKAIDVLFTPPLRRGFRRRLEEVAYVFWKTDRERAARQAVAAAFAITDTGSLRTHPLLRAIVTASIELVLLVDETGLGPPPDADRSAYTPI